jgi:Lon protease-like protein
MGDGEPELVPLFPLHTVLFPGGVLPLHVFEDRYRVLVEERLDFGIVLIRRGRDVGVAGAEQLHQVGTMATLQRVEELPDGRFSVVVRGLHRFRLLSVEQGRPYLMGRVERLPEPPALARPRLLSLLERYLAAHGVALGTRLGPELQLPAGAGPQRAVWLVGALLRVEAPHRQELLETGDPDLAEALLVGELAKLSTIGRLGPMHMRPPSPN